MSAKKVGFGARPAPARIVDPAAAEAFVAGGAEQPVHVPVQAPVPEPEKPAEKPEKVKIKRLTIDIDAPLHKRLKTMAAEEDTTIADVARKLLLEWADSHDTGTR